MLNKLFLNKLTKSLFLISCSFLSLCVSGLPLNSTNAEQVLLPYCQNCQFETTKAEFEKRENLILKNTNFKPWKSAKQNRHIITEFESLDKWRKKLWYHNPKAKVRESKTLFTMAKDLQTAKYFHYADIIAFQYNRSDPSYNASTILLNGRCFFALEAPTLASEQRFLKFLHNHHVTHLVRLTPERENGIEKCYPYWQGKLRLNKNNQEKIGNQENQENQNAQNAPKNVLKFPITFPGKKRSFKEIAYFSTDNWLDGAGYKAEDLLDLILAVKTAVDADADAHKQYKNIKSHFITQKISKTKPEIRSSNEADIFIACHCHAGAGRTGTFIAGFLLIDEIDQQVKQGIPLQNLNISVEKVVKQLSLQRPYMVQKAPQYATLYRLVDVYINRLKDSQIK